MEGAYLLLLVSSNILLSAEATEATGYLGMAAVLSRADRRKSLEN